MFLVDLLRILRFAGQNFWRNFWLTVVTISIITLALISVSFLLVFNLVANNVLDVVQAKSEIYIDLTGEAKLAQVEFLVEELGKLSDIKEVRYITPEETLQRFQALHQDDEIIMESLQSLDDNPFTGSILLRVEKIDQFPLLLTEISRPEYSGILEINNTEFYQARDLIEAISEYSNKIEKIGFAFSVFFIIISIVVVFNTIQMGIYSHREEINIMKLVGASNWFVRMPFIIEGILYSLVAIFIIIVLLYPLVLYLQPYLDNFLGEYSLDLVKAINNNFILTFGLEALIAILITTVSSLLATRRYLRI